MSFDNGPRVANRGLLIALDAADRSSYIGSGTAWNDVSGNGINGTLVNSPTYSTDNAGYFVFNGSNTRVELPSRTYDFSTGLTIEMWVYPTTIVDFARLIDFGPDGASVTNTGPRFYGSTNGRFTVEIRLSQQSSNINIYIANVWQQLVFVANGTNHLFYKNGIFDRSSADTGLPTTITRTPRVGSNIGGGEVFTGRIAIARVYNQALTATEVLQNFNALRSRFGL